MRLRQFEAFYWIAWSGSFDAAARHLRVAQPSVSARVRKIEKHLGIRAALRRPGFLTRAPA